MQAHIACDGMGKQCKGHRCEDPVREERIYSIKRTDRAVISKVEPGGRSPVLSLYQACLKAGQDGGGRRCLACLVRHLCACDARWLVRLPELSQ